VTWPRGLAVRLKPRSYPAERSDGDREGTHVRLCHSRMLFVRAYRPRRRRWCLTLTTAPSRCSRTPAGVDGGDGLYRQRPCLQSPLPADVQSLPRRSGRLHAGIGLGERVRSRTRSGVRERFFTPRLRFQTYDEMNAWLLDKYIAYAKGASPSGAGRADNLGRVLFEGGAAEASSLCRRFDGFHAVPASVAKT
jgi:hypothetical protein